MFLKPHRVKSQTQLKGSDKKKLNSEIKQNFPSLTEDTLAEILPLKGDVVLVKAICTKGEFVHIYQIQREPLFFKIDKDGIMYPTVYLLWRYPTLIKTFTTYTNVISRLMQGADLMLPGIVLEGELKMNSYGKFNKDTMVAVNTVDNACPFAIGKTALSSMDMYMSARQGKGVVILHIYRDFLWEMGSKSPIAEMDIPKVDITEAASESEDPNSNVERNSDTMSFNLEGMNISSEASVDTLDDAEQDGPKRTAVEEMDELFFHCFFKSLKTTAKKVELPILTLNFYLQHMVSACPSHLKLDIKKSSFKKLSKFLNAMVERNLIEVKEFRKGVDSITGINWAHEDIKNFIFDENEISQATEQSKMSSANEFVPPVLEEVYQVSGTTVQFFKRNGLSKGDVLTRADVRAVVTDYIQKKNLKKKDKVEVDPLLHEAVVGPKEGYKELLRWDEIFSRLLGKMSPAFRFSRPGHVPIIRKGKLEPIEMVVAKRSGNKRVTLIYNVSTFGIDEKEFAHQIQVGVATSTSVGPAENKPPGTTQVLVQGNQILFVGKLLIDTYKIPKKYIRGLELAQKKKN